jgi:MYXO-CTERM domain-containing protein
LLCGFALFGAVALSGCEPADSPEAKALEQAAQNEGYDPAQPYLTATSTDMAVAGGGDAAVVVDMAKRPDLAHAGGTGKSDCSYGGHAASGAALPGLLMVLGALFLRRRRDQ